MRLKETCKVQIIELAKLYFGNDIKLYLFGSRVDDNKKGGDIDLFLESDHPIDLEMQIKFLSAIQKNVTERKIDLVVKTPFDAYKPIFDAAKNQGILLC